MILGIFLKNPHGVLVGPNCCRFLTKENLHGGADPGFFFVAQRRMWGQIFSAFPA